MFYLEGVLEFLKKTILLTNDSKEIGVLNLVKTSSGIFGNFKSYFTYVGDMLLGITVNGLRVYKQNIVCSQSKGYDFKMDKDFDLNGKIGRVLLKKEIEKYEPFIWGVNGDIVGYKSIIMQQMDIKNKHQVNELSKSDKQITELGQNKDNVENKIVEDVKQEKDVYENKDETYQILSVGVRDGEGVEQLSQENLFEADDCEIEATINENFREDAVDFFDMISEQIDALFNNYPREEALENLIPNSRWVKVDYENNGKIYVVGLVYEMEILKYVAYGVPAENMDLENELAGYGQWISLNPLQENSNGYWVIFQDAITGDNVNYN